MQNMIFAWDIPTLIMWLLPPRLRKRSGISNGINVNFIFINGIVFQIYSECRN